MFRRHKKLFIWLEIFILFAGAGVAGYILASNEPRVVEATPEAEMPVDAEDAKIAKGAIINWDYEYGMCSHHIKITSEADENMVGLSFSEFQIQYPDVRIVTFEPGRLDLKVSFDCYCPEHYILRRYEDELAIFRTIIGTDEQEIFLEIPLRFNDVSAEERSVLDAGKLFNSIEELERYIENLDT